MTKSELFEYIKNRKYHCNYCKLLQEQVVKHGLKAIIDYDDMICGGVEDMKIRLDEVIE